MIGAKPMPSAGTPDTKRRSEATGLDDARLLPGTRLLHPPSQQQRDYLARGLNQPGGKLPLFDEQGQRVSPRTIQACIDQGWAAPWFNNPMKPDWLVCRLTAAGRAVARRSG